MNKMQPLKSVAGGGLWNSPVDGYPCLIGAQMGGGSPSEHIFKIQLFFFPFTARPPPTVPPPTLERGAAPISSQSTSRSVGESTTMTLFNNYI